MRNLLYNLIINDFSNNCYENCLNYIPNDATILDVGIGNGKMLKRYHRLIKSKHLKITGVDINRIYLNNCSRLIQNYNLENHLKLYHQPIESFEPSGPESFDFILFTMSFMLFENQISILDKVRGCLKPGGNIIFFQTMFREKSRLMEFIKPRLKFITTVDFGKVTYENEFLELLEAQNLSVTQNRSTAKNFLKGECRMIVCHDSPPERE